MFELIRQKHQYIQCVRYTAQKPLERNVRCAVQ